MYLVNISFHHTSKLSIILPTTFSLIFKWRVIKKKKNSVWHILKSNSFYSKTTTTIIKVVKWQEASVFGPPLPNSLFFFLEGVEGERSSSNPGFHICKNLSLDLSETSNSTLSQRSPILLLHLQPREENCVVWFEILWILDNKKQQHKPLIYFFPWIENQNSSFRKSV